MAAKGSTNGLGRSDRKAMGKSGEIGSGQRQTMGTSVYSMRPDAPSASAFRQGMVEHKQGVDKSDAPDNRTSKRKGVMARMVLGARYVISPSQKQAYPGPDARVQASSKIVPAVMGARSNFWDQERSYGAL